MAKYSNGHSNSRAKTTEEIYKSMCDLKKDLYYKDIVMAHKDIIQKGTRDQIADITWRFNNQHISIHEMFRELEGLRSGYRVTDSIVKHAINYARANYTSKSLSKKSKSKSKR